MILFAMLFFFSLFLSIKNITEKNGPYYVCITITNLCAWIILYAKPNLGNLLMCTCLGLAGFLIYFMMRTKPYEES